MEHYLFRDSYTDHWINLAWLAGAWGDETRDKAERQLQTTLREGRELWLLSEAPEVEAQAEAAGYRFSELAEGYGIRRGQREQQDEVPDDSAGGQP